MKSKPRPSARMATFVVRSARDGPRCRYSGSRRKYQESRVTALIKSRLSRNTRSRTSQC